MIVWFFFFFKQKTAYEMRISDWSSDVCSSDLEGAAVALEIAKLFEQAGLPAGLFQVVLGGADEALSLAAHQDVAVVTLTGGTAAGEALARAAGAKPFLGELGGNSANIVCADADLGDAAKRLAASAFEASGQQCRSEEHTSELQSLMRKSYAVFCLKKTNRQ